MRRSGDTATVVGRIVKKERRRRREELGREDEGEEREGEIGRSRMVDNDRC